MPEELKTNIAISKHTRLIKVCVLVATYNGISWLKEQLDSITTQEGVDVTIYVSDDISVDGTTKWLLTHQHFYKFNLLPAKKSGGAATNFFRLLTDVDFNEFNYVALSDQDDIWQPHKLSMAVTAIELKKVDVYSSNVTAFWQSGRKQLIDKAQCQVANDYMFESAGPGCTFVMSQHFACDLKRFILANQEACKNIVMHDWFIYAFARNAGYRWFIDNHPTMLYRQHFNNAIGANVGLSSFLARLRLIREGWYRDQIILTAYAIGYANNRFIKRLKRLTLIDRLVLAINVTKFRRKCLDQIAFVFLVFLMQKNQNRHK